MQAKRTFRPLQSLGSNYGEPSLSPALFFSPPFSVVLCNFIEILLNLMEFYRILWIYMDFYGILWIFMEFCEFSGI